jgi:hypothetical protein
MIRSWLWAAALLVMAIPLAATPEEATEALAGPTVTYRTAGATDLENRLARPVEVLRLVEPSPLHLIGHLAWLYGVELDIDPRVVGSLADGGQTSIDIRGGDAFGALESAADTGGLAVVLSRGRILLARPGDPRDVEPGASKVEIVERRPEDDREVTGLVVEAGGRPVAGALVAAEGRPPVQADGNGRFRCPVPKAGGRVRAWMAGRLPSAPVEVGDADLVIEIGRRTASVVVRAVDGETGDPVSDALVFSKADDDVRLTGPTRRDGSVVLGEFASGTVVVRAAGRGHGVTESTVPIRTGRIATVTLPLPRTTLAERLRSERLPVSVEGIPLGRALFEYARRAVLPIRFARSFSPGTARRPVSLDLEVATLGEALEALLETSGASIRIDEAAALVWIEVR